MTSPASILALDTGDFLHTNARPPNQVDALQCGGSGPGRCHQCGPPRADVRKDFAWILHRNDGTLAIRSEYGTLVELVQRGPAGLALLVWNEGKASIVEQFEHAGWLLVPPAIDQRLSK